MINLLWVESLFLYFQKERNKKIYQLTNYSKNSAFFFLLVFITYLAGGIALNSFSYYPSLSSSTNIILKKQCQKSSHFSHINQAQNKFSTAKEFPLSDQQPVVLSSCNTSIQILIATNNFVFESDKRNRLIRLKNPFLSSQIFAFQEPDPPRFV